MIPERTLSGKQKTNVARMAAGTVSPETTPNRKPLDVNKYATKKTIAQGMLDIALLTANASQLKYVLQVGEKHEFYSLMLGLISISIILQIIIGVLLLTLNLLRDCRLHLEEFKTSATYINYITTALSVAITAVNLLISAFDPSLSRFVSSTDTDSLPFELIPKFEFINADEQTWSNISVVIVGILFLVIGGFDIKKIKDQNVAVILNDIILVLIFIISLINVIISSFGMEYSNNQLHRIHSERSMNLINPKKEF